MKILTGKERMSAWRNLPEPKPAWETFKRLLGQFHTVEKVMEWWHEKKK